jgi:hypothetical protein
MFLGLPDPDSDPRIRILLWIRILLSSCKKKKLCLKIFFAGILKVNDENGRIRIKDPDPSVRGMDPRIRIRIHPKM